MFAKTYFQVQISVGILDFLYQNVVRWTKLLNLVDLLVMETLVWTLYFIIRKYLDFKQYYMMLLQKFDHIVVKTWLLLYDWARTKFMFAWSRYWIALLPLRKAFSTLHFQLCRLLKQQVFQCTRYRADWKKTQLRSWDFLLMVLYKDFHFVQQRLLNLINRQHRTQVIYMELRGVVESWIMGSCLLSCTTWKKWMPKCLLRDWKNVDCWPDLSDKM